MRLLKPTILLLFCAVLCGCPPLRAPGLEKRSSEELFFRSFEMPPSEQMEVLRRLQTEAPSPWSRPAGQVLEWMTEGRELTQRLARLEHIRQECENERRRMMGENSRLEEETARLQQDLEKLKTLIIEMEMRSHRLFSPSPDRAER